MAASKKGNRYTVGRLASKTEPERECLIHSVKTASFSKHLPTYFVKEFFEALGLSVNVRINGR